MVHELERKISFIFGQVLGLTNYQVGFRLLTYFSEKNMLCVYYRKTGKIAVVATPHAFLPRTSRIYPRSPQPLPQLFRIIQ